MSCLVIPGNVARRLAKQQDDAKALHAKTEPVAEKQVGGPNPYTLPIYDIDTPVPAELATAIKLERWQLLVMPVNVRDRIGSIFLPQSATDAQLWINGIGKVCAVGPSVFRGKKYLDQGLSPEDGPKIGDLVIYNAKTPNRIIVDGRTLIFVADDAISCRVHPDHAHRITF